MKPSIIELPHQIIPVRDKLLHMKDLKSNVIETQAEFDMLKKQVIEDWFSTHEEYMTEKGLILATYKGAMVRRFNQSRFREDYPGLFNLYCDENNEMRFLLK